jgi:tetrahydromethanopterin S-methyltransferase subunit B
VGLIAAIHSSLGHRMPSLTQWDLRLRFVVVFGLLGASVYGLALGLPGWIILKIAIFAVLVACGIAVRFALKPFAIAYARMLDEGASDAGNNAMITHMGIVRRYVWTIWVGLFVNAALGLHLIAI